VIATMLRFRKSVIPLLAFVMGIKTSPHVESQSGGSAWLAAKSALRSAASACRNRAREADSSPHFSTWADRLMTCRFGRAGRGGSHGLGKGVLWKFSQISTVLFSSTLRDRKPSGLRLFGRADIPSHKLDDVWYTYGGFLGLPGVQVESDRKAAWACWLCPSLLVCARPGREAGTRCRRVILLR
jgi:hypothetical protein